jgi:hypothetical protein
MGMGVAVRAWLSTALVVALFMSWGCAHPLIPQQSPTLQGMQNWRELHFASSVVRLSIPTEWIVSRNEPRGTGHFLLVDIPFPAAVGTPHASQLALATTTSDTRVDVRAYAAWSLQDAVANHPASSIAGYMEGSSWLTVIHPADKDGLGLAVIDRFGVAQGDLAHLRVTIPLITRAPLSWFDTTISQVNAVIRSFTMGGENPSTSELAIEEGFLVLRSKNPNQPLNSPFSFQPRGIFLGGSPSAK